MRDGNKADFHLALKVNWDGDLLGHSAATAKANGVPAPSAASHTTAVSNTAAAVVPEAKQETMADSAWADGVTSAGK